MPDHPENPFLNNPFNDPPKPTPPQPPGHRSARVPEKISRGVLATGFLISHSPTECVIDFFQFFTRPHQLAARVVLAPPVAAQFAAVLKENLGNYHNQFGPPPTMPKPPAGEQPRTVQEIYDELKLTDEMLTGTYANNIMVGHTPAEFSLDFITGFYPTAVVSARVFLAAPRVPQLLASLEQLIAQHQAKQSQPPANPPQPPRQQEPPPAQFP